jgi:diguanylate cyclase (GGDEF)-like protein
MVPLGLIVPSLVGWAVLEGEKRSLLSPTTGVAVLVIATSAALAAAVLWGRHLLGVIDDERRKSVAMAPTDDLTELRSRRGFLDVAAQQLLVARRLGQPMILCFIHLRLVRRVKQENGAAEGDRAVRDFATLLRSTFRASDVLGRLAEDEFVVLAINTTDGPRLETGLADALERYNAVAGRSCGLAARVGSALCNPAARDDIEVVLEEARKTAAGEGRSSLTARVG